VVGVIVAGIQDIIDNDITITLDHLEYAIQRNGYFDLREYLATIDIE
jgi:hypothetical protein